MATNKQTIEFNAKGVKRLKKQYKELERRTRGLEKSTRGGSSALGGMVAKLGITTAALYATTKAMTGIVKAGAGFEKTMSNLRAISGATGEEMKALEKNARDLGKSTVFTATQVGELSVEFAKLGFSSKQITAVTKDTLALAAASGSDLATAAAVAGQTLRAFGMRAKEMSKVTDTMAAAFSGSALDMEKFTNSMAYVAPVAKAVGFSVEGTTALLGGLANAGISGSMAGTALRTVFLKLADSNSDLSQRLGGSVKSADDLLPALKKLSDSAADLTEILGLVDKRAVSAFKVLLDGSDDVAKLKDALDNSAGAAQEMAEVQLDNLAGKTTLLGSAMEGLGISIFDHLVGPMGEAVDSVIGLVNAMNDYFAIPTADKLRAERDATFGLIAVVRDLGASTELRKEAIKEINNAYGEYLPNLLTGESSLDEIDKAYDKILEAMTQKIALAVNEAKISEELKKQMALRQTEKALIEELAVAEKNLETRQKERNDVINASEKNTVAWDLANSNTLNRISGATKIIERSKKALEENKDAQSKLTDKIKELNTDAMELAQSFISVKNAVDDAGDSLGGGTDPIDEQGKALAESLKTFDAWMATQEKALAAKEQEILYNEVLIENYPKLAEGLGLIAGEQQAIQDISTANQALYAENLDFQLMQIDLQAEKYRQMKLDEVAITQFTEDAKLNAVINNLESQSVLYNSFMAGYDQFVNTMVDTEMRKEEKIKTLQEAAKNAFVQFLASQLKEYIANLIAQQIIAKAGEATAVASALVTGTAIASAYAVPASLASTASFGGAAVAGTTAITASIAATKAMAVALAEGGDFITKGPQLLMVGEEGKERVSVTPVENSNLERTNTGSVINVNISGGVVDESYVANELIPALNKATSLGNPLN